MFARSDGRRSAVAGKVMLGLEASDVPNLGQQQPGYDRSHALKLQQSRSHRLDQLIAALSTSRSSEDTRWRLYVGRIL